MKLLTILLNLTLLGLSIFLFFDNWGGLDGKEIFYFIIMTITPLLSLYLIFQYKESDWLSLFLKRKALEEKKKIEKLQDEKL